MTQLIQSAVRRFLEEKIGTLPEAVRIEVRAWSGMWDVRVLYGGTRIWHVETAHYDAVLDSLDVDWELIEERIHRLAYSCLGAW